MDGTLGSQTARLLDGSGVQITSGDELAEIVRRGAAAGFPVAVHAIGDRANREALDAFEQTRDALGAARPAPPDRARAAARARGRRRASPRSASLLGAVLARAVRPRPRRPLWAGKTDGAYAFRSLLDSGAVVANGSRRADRGARPARRDPRGRPANDRRAAGVAPRAGGDGRAGVPATCVAPAWLAGDERRRGTLIPGHDADLVVLDRDPWDDLDAQVVATMVAGRWVHNPPPWD